MKNRHKLVGNIFLICGAAALLSCCVLFAINSLEDSNAGKSCYELTKSAKEVSPALENAYVSDGASSGKSESDLPVNTDKVFRVVDVDGYPCCGVLSIPDIELEMVVFDTWNDDYLKRSICRYYGSPLTNDLVIAGHNYRSGFGMLNELEIGDEIYFTDMDGNVTAYRVADVEVLQGTAVTAMVESGWDLSLYTCTNGGSARYTVRAERFGEG